MNKKIYVGNLWNNSFNIREVIIIKEERTLNRYKVKNSKGDISYIEEKFINSRDSIGNYYSLDKEKLKEELIKECNSKLKKAMQESGRLSAMLSPLEEDFKNSIITYLINCLKSMGVKVNSGEAIGVEEDIIIADKDNKEYSINIKDSVTTYVGMYRHQKSTESTNYLKESYND